MTAPWWTDADAAELDVLVDELVRTVFDHRPECPVCVAGRTWCAVLRDCFEIVIEWRRSRSLRSRAEWLRERRDQLNANATTEEVAAA